MNKDENALLPRPFEGLEQKIGYKFKDKETLFTQIEKDVNAVKTGSETTIVGEDK